MTPLFLAIISSLIAGMAMPLGGLIASVEKLQPGWLEQEFRHSVIAFGGGALLAAVALVLVPEGIASIDSPAFASLLLLSGGGCFAILDRFLEKRQTPAGQLLAMLSDFIPEAMALGAAFTAAGSGGFLLAGLIALQNLPEGFNAFREMRSGTGFKTSGLLFSFASLTLLGPLAALTGYFWLSREPMVLAATMMFAAGGILYSVFQDIAPQAKLKKHQMPPLWAVMGFTLGVVGHYLTT